LAGQWSTLGNAYEVLARPKCTTYSISKAAVNMLTVHQSEQLKDRGIKVICMDPGKPITNAFGIDNVINETQVGSRLAWAVRAQY
jgi:NAD(P)-dependent dehydrogenase (short-subunit alcohol dehydrogenase family)